MESARQEFDSFSQVALRCVVVFDLEPHLSLGSSERLHVHALFALFIINAPFGLDVQRAIDSFLIMW